jgi:hypothetical protein
MPQAQGVAGTVENYDVKAEGPKKSARGNAKVRCGEIKFEPGVEYEFTGTF